VGDDVAVETVRVPLCLVEVQAALMIGEIE